MMVENQPVDAGAARRLWAGEPDEAHDCAVAAGLFDQCGELLLWPKRIRLKPRDDAHPPDTGGRNSSVSPSARR